MRIVYPACAVVFFAAACASMTATAQKATTTLSPTKGNTTTGTVTFEQRGDKVVMTAKISGLAPGSHGFHVHEKGDCSADDGTGPSYNSRSRSTTRAGTTVRSSSVARTASSVR